MNKKRKWTVMVDGEEVTFTRQDVKRYGSGNGGSMRYFGSVNGDWRMIDAIAHDAAAYFDMEV